MTNQQKKIILSGMRPTGKLHLGHWAGALENWVSLQHEYQNYHLVADYHALTTNPDTRNIEANTIEMVMDWLAAGIDPNSSLMFRQSQIKEHAELFLIFSMLITKARLERNPSVKDQVRDLHIESIIYGHLGYPVLQAADILLYKGNLVPVGEDQLSHIEITRELARDFNRQYGNVFPEPDARLTTFARLPGLDSNDKKMAKSSGNTIFLSELPDDVWQKLRGAVTDPLKVRKGDPGHPDVCLVFTYHKKFNESETPQIRTDCESGALGCFDCKKKCAEKLNAFLSPHIEKRRYFEEHCTEVYDILLDGEIKARAIAQQTMHEVREAMHLG